MDSLARMLEAASPVAIAMAFSFAFMTALELLLPRERHGLRERLPGLAFWILAAPVTALSFATCRATWDWLGIAPLVVLPLRFDWAGMLAAAVLAPLAGAFVGDFLFYWFHRAQHAWLWRFHAAHHSVRELNAVNAYHHLSEGPIQAALYIVPTSLIVADTGAAVPMVTVLLYLHSSFIHSPTAIHFGPLRALFVDNRFHRIHHSLEERHFDRNFGAFTTFWDRIFGTAHFPARDEWPAVGLHEIDQPRTLRAWLTLPWRFGRAGDRVTAQSPAAA